MTQLFKPSLSTLGLAIRKICHKNILPISLFAIALPAFADEATNSVQDVEPETIVVTASALKVETPLEETPRSASVVDREELEIRQVQKVDEALRYRAGVTSQPYGADNDTDWIKVRGFDAATYLDGNRLFKDGYYGWMLEPFGIERVEVLKGPASILYGEAPPGGVISAVSKRPTDTPQGEIDLQVGNRSHKQIGIDISDYANENGDARYRIVAMANERDGVLDGTYNQRYYLAPSLALDLSDRTTLTLLASIIDDEGVPTNGFFPANGSLIDTPQGKLDPSTNLGEPGYDINEKTQFSLGYALEHEFNDTWTLKQNANYGHIDMLLRSSYVFSAPAVDSGGNIIDPNVYNRGLVYRDGSVDSYSLDTQTVGRFYTDRTEQTLLLGLDLQTHKNEGKEKDDYAFGGPIDIFNHTPGNFTPVDPSTLTSRTIGKDQVGLYAQHQVKLDGQWVMLLGGRYDYVKTKNNNKTSEVKEKRDDSQLSLNGGLMYLASNGFAPYASYSESFEVLTTVDPATGKLYKPLEGQQTEVGVKYTPEFIDGYLNLALFDITQKNALVTNPATYVKTQTGEATSQGVEVEGIGYLTDNLKLTASYTYTDARTDETYGKGKEQRAALIPRHAASAWLDYDFTTELLQGLTLGGGVRYNGETVDNPASSSRTVPSYTLVDAVARYNINNQWQAQLNVNNLFDETYVSSCDYYCYYGEERSVIATLNYRW
ncbi:TonB-dependent siderophore receptor [Photobacterium sp. WH77]|uniref:TonB-dependent siderophore receptor n=1 Tax=unclassified Photobacterium TaxID=2628852 RepID=UPI001EDA51EC|nr:MULTISPECIES: TonB-dependent siderophore receptor [unclassified Photobacterium]MCG2838370.1 TonB-dependent siderophore receptor [Photobacterium sp. WH77]MCG2845915.1 TonB-dependent siderophore receptor [Photobacterium sp. WH80]